jgi:hypothetical protein
MCIHYRDHSVNEFRRKITAYCGNNTEHTNTLCGQNGEIFKLKLFLALRRYKILKD